MLNPIKRTFSIYSDTLPSTIQPQEKEENSPLIYSKLHSEYSGLTKQQRIQSSTTNDDNNQLVKLDLSNSFESQALSTKLIEIRDKKHSVKPDWHAPWKLSRVISGHIGAVRAVGMNYFIIIIMLLTFLSSSG